MSERRDSVDALQRVYFDSAERRKRTGTGREHPAPTAPPEHDDEPAGDAQSKLFEEERIP